MKYLVLIVVLVLAAVLVRQVFFSFQSQKLSDYASDGPPFDIRQAFDGPVIAHGMIYGPNGRVTSRFRALMVGKFTNTGGVIEETFEYASGRKQVREWRIKFAEDGTISSTADDIEGTARMEQRGNALEMHYRLRLPEDAGGHVLDVTDWIYQMPDGTLLNRSQMRKFGIKVAELFAVMQRETDTIPAQ
ncbi:hypothetical protein DL1_07955 [Thioclava dalianensis]|uniref:Lipoprotein n=1 Tax=Thioclava dalianensis TaxID=1185766 RepID=A0A074TFG8_9RHOB|nr:DUF3833 domain-containing protein [Thioclava dalianensis]KEP68900.1 hypothetical protein DL1_07955 [Thioclava dalianensis]SFN35780.1 Protein of unknown function [Thioclava dalianensis]